MNGTVLVDITSWLRAGGLMARSGARLPVGVTFGAGFGWGTSFTSGDVRKAIGAFRGQNWSFSSR